MITKAAIILAILTIAAIALFAGQAAWYSGYSIIVRGAMAWISVSVAASAVFVGWRVVIGGMND